MTDHQLPDVFLVEEEDPRLGPRDDADSRPEDAVDDVVQIQLGGEGAADLDEATQAVDLDGFGPQTVTRKSEGTAGPRR